jgi:hypothetical protein
MGSSQNLPCQGSLALAHASQEAPKEGVGSAAPPRSGRTWPVLPAQSTCTGGPYPPGEQSGKEIPDVQSHRHAHNGPVEAKGAGDTNL